MSSRWQMSADAAAENVGRAAKAARSSAPCTPLKVLSITRMTRPILGERQMAQDRRQDRVRAMAAVDYQAAARE